MCLLNTDSCVDGSDRSDEHDEEEELEEIYATEFRGNIFERIEKCFGIV